MRLDPDLVFLIALAALLMLPTLLGRTLGLRKLLAGWTLVLGVIGAMLAGLFLFSSIYLNDDVGAALYKGFAAPVLLAALGTAILWVTCPKGP